MRCPTRFFLPTLATSLAACAADPAHIGAAYASPIPYQTLDCQQLALEGYRHQAAEADAAAKQNQIRSEDAVGLILIGLPVSSMSGNSIATEVARLKGEHQALYEVAVQKGRPVQPQQSPRS